MEESDGQRPLMSSQIRRNEQEVIEWLNEELSIIPGVKSVKKATGMSECGQVGIFLLYLLYRALTGGISKELTLLVGTLYPILKSIEAL